MDDKSIGELWLYYQRLSPGRTVWVTKDQVHAEQGSNLIRKLVAEVISHTRYEEEDVLFRFGIDPKTWKAP